MWFPFYLIFWTPLLFSFISFIFFFFFGPYLTNKKLCSFFVSWFLSSVFFSSCFLFYNFMIINSLNFYFQLSPWISIHFLQVSWSFFFDSIVIVMLLVVSIISLLVHLYSLDYMGSDLNITRFISFLSLFTFFMLVLVTSGNFIQLFLGWEGVGLSSYLLINFWYTRLEANQAAIKAIIVNRFGDVGIYLALIGCIFLFKSVDFLVIFSLPHFTFLETFPGISGLLFIDFVNFCLLLGAIGKSAQIGLHTWLPDAMEGPTPVSALIHAATMVTAGVFVLIRCSPIIEFSPNILLIITWVGAFTTIFAASVGCFQNDIKKIIAYSTCSQLGYMFIACGLSGYSVALYHLFNHAFFKALLFLCAGSVIHALFDEQDIRKMGGLVNILPITYITMLIGSLALAGFPFLSGFYSKDYILELSLVSSGEFALIAYWAGTFTVFLTSFYSFRLIYYVFLGSCNFQNSYKTIQESGPIILSVLIFLSFMSLFTGYFFKELFIGLGNYTFINSILVLPEHNHFFLTETLQQNIKLIPLFFSIFGILCSFFCYYIFWPIISYKIIPKLKKVSIQITNPMIFFIFIIMLIRFFKKKYEEKIKPIMHSLYLFSRKYRHTKIFHKFYLFRYYSRKIINTLISDISIFSYYILKKYPNIYTPTLHFKIKLQNPIRYNLVSFLPFLKIYTFFNQKWYFDVVYANWVVLPLLKFSYEITFKLIDRGIIEIFGPIGLVRFFFFCSQIMKQIQSGFLFFYIFLVLLFLFSFIFLVFIISIENLLILSSCFVSLFIFEILMSFYFLNSKFFLK